MNNLEVIGTLTEILYKGERSCKFIIKEEGAELLGTITSRNIDLADSLEVGQVYKFKGNLAAYRKMKGELVLIENTFYAMEIKEYNNKGENK